KKNKSPQPGASKPPTAPPNSAPTTPQRRGRKRRASDASSTSVSSTPSKRGTGTGSRKPKKLEVADYAPNVPGERVLTCGEGEQLGHPGRTVTKKPRAVGTFPEGIKLVQVIAGGVHSLVLSEDGTVYTCGINEKGTVPAKGLAPEETTDKFTEIEFPKQIKALGKIVQLAAGASFSAALTEKGSVVAWGNLRDESGDVTVHHLLSEMQKSPVTIVQKEKIVKIAAGENHLVMLNVDGELLTFGEGSHGQLGRGARAGHIRSRYMADENALKVKVLDKHKHKFVRFVDVFAGGWWTMGKAEDGRLFVCGLNNYGQLGVPLPPTEAEEAAGDVEPKKGEEQVDFRITHLTHAEGFPSDQNWTHVAGVKHIICRNDEGKVFGIGLNTDNILGLGTWEGQADNQHWRYDKLQEVPLAALGTSKVAGIDATLSATVLWTEDGKVFSFGCDTVGQLGLGLGDAEMVSTAQSVTSAHLDDYRVISASIADQHALFLAAKKEQE
ncbi:CBR-RAN-3 protein, partial [Aphelenchoides avenae]